jgi:hypothetical protein
MSNTDRHLESEAEVLALTDLPDFVSNPTLLGLDDKLTLLIKRKITVCDGSAVAMRKEHGRNIVYRGGNPWQIRLVGRQLHFKFDGWTIFRQNDASFIMEKNGQRHYSQSPAHGNRTNGTSGPESHYIENIFTPEDWRDLKRRYGEDKLMVIYKKLAEGKITVKKNKENPFMDPVSHGVNVWGELRKDVTEKPLIASNDNDLGSVAPEAGNIKQVKPVSKIRSVVRKAVIGAALAAGTALAGFGINSTVQHNQGTEKTPAAIQSPARKGATGINKNNSRITDAKTAEGNSAPVFAPDPAADFASKNINANNIDEISQKSYPLPEKVKAHIAENPELRGLADGTVKVSGKKGVIAEMFSGLMRHADTVQKRQALKKLSAEINKGSGVDARMKYAGVSEREKRQINQNQHRKIYEKYSGNGITELETLSKTIEGFDRMPIVTDSELQKNAHAAAIYRNLQNHADTPNIHNPPAGAKVSFKDSAFAYEALNIIYPELFRDDRSAKIPAAIVGHSEDNGVKPLEFGRYNIDTATESFTGESLQFKRFPGIKKETVALNPQPEEPFDPEDISGFRKKLHDRYMAQIDAGWES